MSRNTLITLAGGSLILFTVIGWWIMQYFGPLGLKESLYQGNTLIMQFAVGASLGVLLGFIAWWMVSLNFFSTTRSFFVDIIGPLKLSWPEIIFISCCAGIGEEILFRGAIQPWLGIGWTSLLFVVLHGYITPFNKVLTIYGLFMVLMIALIGYLAIKVGLIAAMVTHTVIDIILLHKLGSFHQPTSEDTVKE